MRILLVGALRAETLPLMGWLERPRADGRRLVVGRRRGLELGVLTCGVGPDKAGARTADALARWPADAVISLGTCGALTDGLAIGDVRCADRLGRDGAPRSAAPEPLPGVAAAAVVTVDAPVLDPGRRAVLAGRGWALCEMEAAAVAAAAGGARFHALKVVSDRAGGDGARFKKSDILKFQALAMRLVASRLAPALDGALARYPSAPHPTRLR